MDRNHSIGRGEQRTVTRGARGSWRWARPRSSGPRSGWPSRHARRRRRGCSQSADASSPSVTVRFVAQATAAQGATGSFRVRTQDTVPVGGRARAYLTAGTAAQPTLCRLGTAAPPASEPPLVGWRVAATVREVQTDSVSLSLEWSREGLAPFRSAASASLGNVRLREGQSHVFDAVVGPPDGSTGCTNVLASVEVDRQPTARATRTPCSPISSRSSATGRAGGSRRPRWRWWDGLRKPCRFDSGPCAGRSPPTTPRAARPRSRWTSSVR